MPTPRFSKSMLTFFRDLERNNTREWFRANKDRFEDQVRDPLLKFIDAFRPRLRRISRHFVADPRRVGGSLFRIYRDTRFSKDKSPYKTYLGVQFRHERAKDVHAPGFYLHVQPGQLFVGVGIWHPDADALGKIRNHIVDHAGLWKRALADKDFQAEFEMGGETLKRPPRGYDPTHALIEDLKRKDFIAATSLTEREFLSANFIDRFTTLALAGRPLARFLTRAVELPW